MLHRLFLILLRLNLFQPMHGIALKLCVLGVLGFDLRVTRLTTEFRKGLACRDGVSLLGAALALGVGGLAAGVGGGHFRLYSVV